MRNMLTQTTNLCSCWEQSVSCCFEKKGKGFMNLSLAKQGLRVFSQGFSIACIWILVCLSTTPAWTQATSTSTITGLVTDQQNAAVPGVEVKLLDRASWVDRHDCGGLGNHGR